MQTDCAPIIVCIGKSQVDKTKTKKLAQKIVSDTASIDVVSDYTVLAYGVMTP